ncbi:MAG: GNAT family N-acetyltransferase [Clostridiales bacterium]|nr:GNAT family N-acetyltransferase [Clostridiales bacterium]
MIKQAREFVIKQLHTSDIFPGLFDTFAHSQKITKKWIKNRESWVLTDASILREWSSEKRIWISEYIIQQINRGGITVGAFYEAQLIGFCCVDGVLSGNSAKYANLTMLFVDDVWKRNGIGRMLFQEACNHAIALGAEKLFISAIPSVETISFYFKMGCIDAVEIVEKFIDSENDRYLEFNLKL